MVHKHRSSQKATTAKDVSPMRNMTANKYSMSSSPSESVFGFRAAARLNVPSSAHSAPADKWKYNNMVNNNRDQFNGMHYC